MSKATPYAEVIGDPIDGSRSPEIHKFWIKKMGMKADYRPQQVARAGLKSYLAERRKDKAWQGCNVTMPLKLDAIGAADRATDLAVAAGAANMLVHDEGTLVAGNSDVGAIVMLLKQLHDKGRAMDRVTLLGNGGAARAVLVAARTVGLTPAIRMQARDLTTATKLAVEFGLRKGPRPIDSPITGDGIINATPLGMKGFPENPASVEGLSDKGWVFDLVTSPPETALLKAARERGLETVDGLSMLVEQAATSFALFFGEEPPRQHDDALFAMLRS
ncbi:shikimate dehydrogenase family protein [Sphingomicrobium clamense]|uniref:Shikimate dehydrogenase n=1 Tax=Sphingomicrobium clamense TaxID=2851013 RepID=A0ABS6V327_9SPHN|nr:shikimate dehydrogenase [Sphingomicrobium sp. B8]MBW0143934.1 shikimate dehydrogenase [Sphingomicrobium sp. B8]